MYMFALIV